MPEECASMRSIARWVLPVLVGPRTAVTPAPRARASLRTPDEKEMGIKDPKTEAAGAAYRAQARKPGRESLWGGYVASKLRQPKVWLEICFIPQHKRACFVPLLRMRNESGTNRGRIGDSDAIRFRSLRHLAHLRGVPLDRVFFGIPSAAETTQPATWASPDKTNRVKPRASMNVDNNGDKTSHGRSIRGNQSP